MNKNDAVVAEILKLAFVTIAHAESHSRTCAEAEF